MEKRIDPEFLLKYLSIFSILFLLEGVLYNHVLYGSFGIAISEYLELSEFVALFIPKSLEVLVFTLLIVPLLIIMFNFFVNREKRQYEKKRTKNSVGRIVILTTIGYILPIGLYVIMRRSYPALLSRDSLVILIFVYIFSVAFQVVVFYKEKLTIPMYLIHFLLYILAFTAYTVVASINEVSKIKNSQQSSLIAYTFEDITITKCDSTIKFIGQTKNYFFLFDKKANSTIVLPRSKITKQVFKNN